MPTNNVANRSIYSTAMAPTNMLCLAALGCATFMLSAPNRAQGQTLIGCDQSSEVLTLREDTLLDPSCVYTGKFIIDTSGVELDCQGARIEDLSGEQGIGIQVRGDIDAPLSDIVVRNCEVSGYNNNVMVSRSNYKELELGNEYENAFENIRIEDTVSVSPRSNGMYLLGYVTGVTFDNVEVYDSPYVGIYFSTGAKNNTIINSFIHDNGIHSRDAEPHSLTYEGHSVYYSETGREGVAFDGARENLVSNNHFRNNEYGSLFLYKNCGEHVSEDGWYPRPYGSNANVIEGNTFSQEDIGIWVAARMAQNQLWQDCSDEAMIEGYLMHIPGDVATDNQVINNTFESVTYGIRVEDDNTVVSGNLFEGFSGSEVAVVVGTKFRTNELGLPVSGTTLHNNVSDLDNRQSPFIWIHGHEDSDQEGNFHQGQPITMSEGKQPKMEPFMFTEDIWFIEGREPKNQ